MDRKVSIAICVIVLMGVWAWAASGALPAQAGGLQRPISGTPNRPIRAIVSWPDRSGWAAKGWTCST